MKNLAKVASPLHELLKKNCLYKWTTDCENAFQALKKDVVNATKLSHYDLNKQLILATTLPTKTFALC